VLILIVGNWPDTGGGGGGGGGGPEIIPGLQIILMHK